MSDRERLSRILAQFSARRVLVLGDMVVDEYIVGRPGGISREAPVLVLHQTDSFVRPGGATNPANNIAALGATAAVVGVIGDDQAGAELRRVLEDAGISTAGLVVDGNRPTSTKTRILAGGTQEPQQQQQIVRIDRVDNSTMDELVVDKIVDAFHSALGGIDCLLISDYENGVISPDVMSACLPRALEQGLSVIVDSHGDLFRFKGVTAATPNQPEVEATLGRQLHTDAEVDVAGHELLDGMEAGGVLITRGSLGIALYQRGCEPYHLPVEATAGPTVVDPTGAGDTVSAVFALSLAVGASMKDAAYLANVAGGLVVRKLGAGTVTQQELLSALP